MATNWVNFAEIRAKVSLEDVLMKLYEIGTLKRDGDKLVGACPVHAGDSPRAFHADLTKNVWHCFTKCKKGGNQIDFVAAKENISIRDAALKLQSFFLGEGGVSRSASNPAADSPPGPRGKSGAPAPHPKQDQAPVEENPPLNVKLDLKGDHPHLLTNRRLKLETTSHFGIGYCARGILRGMIAIPIHDEEGQRVAYAGRRLKPSEIREFGKYKFPKGFHKELVLYNLGRAKEFQDKQGLMLVEGFFSVFKLHEAGFPNVVAAMGSDLSEHQAKLLADSKEVIILFDGNEAGYRGAEAARERLMGKTKVRLVRLPDGYEPEDLSPKALRWLVQGMQILGFAEVSFRLEDEASKMPASDR